MNAHIISIGDELLIGDTVNTNASWMGQFLYDHFIPVSYVHTIRDDYDTILRTLKFAFQNAELVLMTGGLGPTNDDITKKVVTDYFDASLILHEPTLEHVKELFKKYNITFSKSNYGQAQVPDNAEVLFNKAGTAPGLWFDTGENMLAVLPGIPSEMKHLMKNKVLPRLLEREGTENIAITKYIKTAGVGESTLSDLVLNGFEDHMPDGVAIASLPNNGGVTIRLSARGADRAETESRMEQIESFIHQKAESYIYATDRDTSLSEAVGETLKNRNLTISTAESCTGGLISGALTDIPGSSAYTLGGIVAYANQIKTGQLDVSEKDLELHGAVSEPVALQMAAGVAQKFGSDIGVSTTGIAGPGGGSDEKPVGTIWMGFYTPDTHFAIKTVLSKNRQLNRERTVSIVLETVRRIVAGIEEMPYGLEKQSA